MIDTFQDECPECEYPSANYEYNTHTQVMSIFCANCQLDAKVYPGEPSYEDLPLWLRRMDWRLLRDQKGHLFELAQDQRLTDDQRNACEGILSWLDAMMDWTVDVLHLDEQRVFGGERPPVQRSKHTKRTV